MYYVMPCSMRRCPRTPWFRTFETHPTIATSVFTSFVMTTPLHGVDHEAALPCHCFCNHVKHYASTSMITSMNMGCKAAAGSFHDPKGRFQNTDSSCSSTFTLLVFASCGLASVVNVRIQSVTLQAQIDIAPSCYGDKKCILGLKVRHLFLKPIALSAMVLRQMHHSPLWRSREPRTL